MRSLQSEHWHEVRHLRPRLRDGVQPLFRRIRGHRAVLLYDPVGQKFHRMSMGIWALLQSLDGRSTVEEVWISHGAQGRRAVPDAEYPTQEELVQLLTRLHQTDLLQTDETPNAAEVAERHRRQKWARLRQSILNPLSIKVPLLYPEGWYRRNAGWITRLVSWPVFVAWAVLVVPAAVQIWQHWPQLTENMSDRVLSASNLLLLWFVYPVVKALHEWAHGAVVKAFGGEVREMGLIFVAFSPVPYVDATSAYAFQSKWQRALVGLAGIMAELALGAVAMYVWLGAESGLVSAVAFNVVLIATVSTLVVNGNPLMRYDGYFVFCEVMETPNLAQRATRYWTYLLDRYVFGSRQADMPIHAQGERWLLALFGIASPIYRLIVVLGLAWFVAGEYMFVGVVMALAALWTALVVPLWRGWKHLMESAELAHRRPRAVRRAAYLVGGLVLLLVAVPIPFRSVHQGVVWVPDESIVRAQADGELVALPITPGARIDAGAHLGTLLNPALAARHREELAALEAIEVEGRRALAERLPEASSIAAERMARSRRLSDTERELRGLAVSSVVPGRWFPNADVALRGRLIRRGEILGYVVQGPSAIVRVAVSQEDMALVRARWKGSAVRLENSPDVERAGVLARVVPGAGFELVSAALGTSGGGEIPVDPQQGEGTRALGRIFDVEVRLAVPSTTQAFGDRAHVRFDLGSAPIAWQVALRLRQLFVARLNV